jgi:hypothetical protein
LNIGLRTKAAQNKMIIHINFLEKHLMWSMLFY